VASIVPSPLPHRHVGISIADIVGDIQLIKTAILRQGLDNLYLSNNPQKVVNQNLVNLDDVLTSVPGGIVRTDDVNSIRYEIPPFVFPQAMEGLEYMDQIKENRTGTNRYFTGIDQNALNKTATGIQQLSTMAAQRVEQIARVFASGVEDLARIMHELIIKSGHRKEVVRLRGNWVEIDPATWRRRTDFKIAVGFGSGNKDAMVSRLMLLNQKQLEAIQLGLPVVQPQNVYETLMELVKASDFSSPDRFFTDPGTVEPKPQPPDPNMLKIELEGKKAAVDAELEQERLRLDDKKIDADALIKKYQIDKDAEIKLALEQMKLGAEFDLEAHKANLGAGMETHKAGLSKEQFDKVKFENIDKIDVVVESTQKIAESLATALGEFKEAVKSLSKPKKVVRDKSGKIVSVTSAD